MLHKDQGWFFNVFRLVVVGLVLFSGIISVAVAQNPVPLINQPLVPDSAKPGGAGFTLTVNGWGFVSGALVHWNGRALATTFLSGSRLTASVPASDIATASTASVTVVNPGKDSGASNVAFFSVTSPTPSVVLGSPAAFVAQSNPVNAAVGDFNDDGKLDLVVANNGSNNVSVLLGNGDGTFQRAVDYWVQNGPTTGTAVADFNGDGKLDLAVANNDGGVSVLLGNGDGTFQPAVNYDAGPKPSWVALGDFNGDGKLDLAVSDQSGPNGPPGLVSILLGNGDGTFRTHVDYDAGNTPNGVAVGDFNGDGKLDLAVANGSGNVPSTVSILLGNGDGTFQSPVAYPIGINGASVATADFNGDGKLDLAVVDFGPTVVNSIGSVSILLGNGDGTFKTHVDYSAGSFPVGTLGIADFNADGKLDFAVANSYSNALQVFLGNGDGTFQSPLTFAAGSLPHGVAVGDFDESGRLGFAVPDNDVDTFAIILQIPTVSLSATSLEFAKQTVGTSSAAQRVTLSNTGGLPLTISSIAVTGTDAGDFRETNTCGTRLPAGGNCTISLTFTPTETGPLTASGTITDNAAGGPQSIAVSGTGLASGPNATLSPTSLSFATQLVGTGSSAESITLTNYGTVALSITSISFTGADSSDFAQTNTCGTSVASGASCTISVTFTPAEAGPAVAELEVNDNAPGSPQKVSLSGTGTIVKLVPGSLRFSCEIKQGKEQCSAPQTTTLTNTGATTLAISSIKITGSIYYFHQTNNCGASVGPGGSCSITVSFFTSGTGSFSGDVAVTDNGGGSPQQVALSGSVFNKGNGAGTLAIRSALAAHSTAIAPAPTGSSPIGTTVMDLVDSTRVDPYLHDGTNRELLVRFWYPASAEQYCKLADYTSPRVWNYFAALTGLPLPAVTTNSCLDVPIADGEHPVIVFTHGYTGTFTDYTFLFEDLASRGYIVVSIDHTYEATAVEFPDERLVKSLVGSHLINTWQTDDQTLSSALSVRLDDLKFVVDELERLNMSSGTAFAGRLDLTRLALAGHSLGGLTTWFGVQRDARFKAGVLLDPYLPDIPVGSTEAPIMFLTMGREQRNEDECQLWSDLRGPRLAVNLRSAEHVTPSDLAWLAKGAVKTGPMGPEKTIEALRDYIAAFLDTNVRGRPLGPLLTGPSSILPDAEVTTQRQLLCRLP